jgi:hypothetical protein
LAPVHVGGHGRHARAALPATLARGILNTNTNTDTDTDAAAEPHADALGVAIADPLGRSDGHADADHLRLGVLVHDADSQPVAEPGGRPRTGLTWRMREGRRTAPPPPRNALAIYRSSRPLPL